VADPAGVKVLVLYGEPADRDLFDAYFEQTHRPLLAKIDRLDALSINRVAGAASDASPYRVVAKLHFGSEEAMQEGLNSESGQKMARDFPRFASGGATILFCHSSTEAM
jgi:uncharacterized protein (TIGR02118 family)